MLVSNAALLWKQRSDTAKATRVTNASNAALLGALRAGNAWTPVSVAGPLTGGVTGRQPLLTGATCSKIKRAKMQKCDAKVPIFGGARARFTYGTQAKTRILIVGVRVFLSRYSRNKRSVLND